VGDIGAGLLKHVAGATTLLALPLEIAALMPSTAAPLDCA
jgi:hypothetical protein